MICKCGEESHLSKEIIPYENGYRIGVYCEHCQKSYISAHLAIENFSMAHFAELRERDDKYYRLRMNIPDLDSAAINKFLNNLFFLCDHDWEDETPTIFNERMRLRSLVRGLDPDPQLLSQCGKCKRTIYEDPDHEYDYGVDKALHSKINFLSIGCDAGKNTILECIEIFNPDIFGLDHFPDRGHGNRKFCVDFYRFLMHQLNKKLNEVRHEYDRILLTADINPHIDFIDVTYTLRLFPFFHRYMYANSVQQITDADYNVFGSNVRRNVEAFPGFVRYVDKNYVRLPQSEIGRHIDNANGRMDKIEHYADAT
jgi:hypothetical protein